MKRDYTLTTATRVFDILENLAQQESRIDELSRRTQIPKSTLFRYLVTLEERGYVRRKFKNGTYVLGLKLLELSNRALAQTTIHELALPNMRRLQDRFRETVNLAVLERNRVVYIEILESDQAFKMSSQVGGREYSHCTAIGKAMLAYLPEDEVRAIAAATNLPKMTDRTITVIEDLMKELEAIRQRGYSIDNGENEEAARCVGAPIFDRRGQVAAAISISGPAQRLSADMTDVIGTALVEISAQISQESGFKGEK